MSYLTRSWAFSAAVIAVLSLLDPSAHAASRKALPKTAADAPFTFVVYGDTRSNPDDHRAVMYEIVQLRPEFVLQSGDLVSDGRNAAQWHEFDVIKAPLSQDNITYYPARGNHDLGPYYILYVPKSYDSGNGYYYAFTRHRNRFIILDNFEDFSPGSKQYQWLKAQLAQAQKTAINTFVMFHEAPYSVGPHGPTPECVQYLTPLFATYHPKAVFCGHDHLYYRTVRDGGVHYFVTGGGGAPLYTPDNRALAVPGDVYATAHHAIRITVNGTHVTATVFGAVGPRDRSSVTVTHVSATGSADTTVTKSGSEFILDRVSF